MDKRAVEGRHAHCGKCGVLLLPGAVHAVECKLRPGQYCDVDGCKRLLMPGAQCETHGAKPMPDSPAPEPLLLQPSEMCDHWMPREDCDECGHA